MGNQKKIGTTRQAPTKNATKSKPTPNDMLTRREAAAVLTVSLSTFDRYVRGKRINRYEASATGGGKRTGRRGPMYFFRRGELDALAAKLAADKGRNVKDLRDENARLLGLLKEFRAMYGHPNNYTDPTYEFLYRVDAALAGKG